MFFSLNSASRALRAVVPLFFMAFSLFASDSVVRDLVSSGTISDGRAKSERAQGDSLDSEARGGGGVEPPRRAAVADGSGKTSDSAAPLGFRKDLLLRLNELIKKVERNSTVLASGFNDDLKLALLKGFAAALGEGVEYVPALDAGKEAKPKEVPDAVSYRPAIIIHSGKVLYLRINRFDSDALSGLRKDAANLADMAGKPLGLIIDLRTATGSNPLVAAEAASLFTSVADVKPGAKQAFPLPVIMLVDGGTTGAAELFAALLVRAGRGVCLGESTAGRPFEKRRVQLANGDYLLIPQVPGRFKDFLETALKPDIRFPAKPMLSYDDLKASGEGERGDKCVERAVELLVCLNAISTRESGISPNADRK